MAILRKIPKNFVQPNIFLFFIIIFFVKTLNASYIYYWANAFDQGTGILHIFMAKRKKKGK